MLQKEKNEQNIALKTSQVVVPDRVADKASTLDIMFSMTDCCSMERKHTHSRHIQEYYCTITSPAFAIPLLFCIKDVELHSLTAQAIFFSCLAGFMSTVYHATLFKITSTLDVCFAAIANYVVCIAIISHRYNLRDSLFDHSSILVITLLVLLYGYNWKGTSHVVIPTMGVAAVSQGVVLVLAGDFLSLGVGIVAISCYLADKLKIAPLHPLWHLFGGLYLYFALHNSIN